MNRPLHLLALTLALCFSAAPPAIAQPPTVKEKREQAANEDLQKSLSDAAAATKVLAVTFSANPGAARDNGAMLKAPVTQAWLARHAVVKEITEQSVITTLAQTGAKQKPGGDPVLYIDNYSEPILFPTLGPVKPGSLTQAGSLALAMRLDWTVRSPLLLGDFANRHQATVKPLPHPYADRAAPADFVSRLNACRDLARKKSWREAADAYAALFACAPSVNDGLRLGIMAQEMAFVAGQDKAAKDRFITLRDQYAGAFDLRDQRQLFEYLILCRVIGDHEHNLAFLDDALSSKNAVLIPLADKTSLPWLLEKCHFNDPTEGVSDPSKWPVQLMQKGAKMEKSKEAPRLGPAIDFARWFAPIEAARRYGWCHRKGDKAKCDLIAKAVADWPNGTEAKAMLEAAAAGMPAAPVTDPKPGAPAPH